MFKLFDRAIRFLMFVLALTMLVLGCCQVFFRYALRMPLSWSEELIRYLFVWSTFIGMPVGFDRGSHASFDILSKRVPQKYVPYYHTVLLVLALMSFLFLINYGFTFVAMNMKQTTPALKIPFAYVILAVPVGAIIGVIYVINSIVKLYRKEVE